MIHNIYYAKDLEKQKPQIKKAIALRKKKDKSGIYVKVPGSIGNMRVWKPKPKSNE